MMCMILAMNNPPMSRRVHLVVSKAFVERIDAWRREQSDIPNRSAAIRRLVDAGLAMHDSGVPHQVPG